MTRAQKRVLDAAVCIFDRRMLASHREDPEYPTCVECGPECVAIEFNVAVRELLAETERAKTGKKR